MIKGSKVKKTLLAILAILFISSSTGMAASPSTNQVAWSTQLWSEPQYTEQWSEPEYTEQWSEPEYTDQWSEPEYTDQWREEPLKHLDEVQAETETSVYIKLQMNSTRAIIQNKETTLTAPPQLINGATMLPFRLIGEALGAEIGWDGAEQKITLTSKGKTIVLTVNQTTALVNGKEVKLSAAPIVKNGVTLVPVRFISESLNLEVNYSAQTQTIEIGNQLGATAQTPVPSNDEPITDFEQLYGTWYMWSGTSATELYYKDTGNYATHTLNHGVDQGFVTIHSDGTYKMDHAVWGEAEGEWRLSFPSEINGERIIGIVLLDGPTNVNWAVAPSSSGKVRLLYELMDGVWTISAELYQK